MDLKSYLYETGLSLSEFARQVESTPATIFRISRGQVEPKLSLAVKIHDATKRKVKFTDLLLERA